MNPFDSKWKPSKLQTFTRLLRSREQRRIELMSLPLYWKLHAKKLKLNFFLRKSLFKVKWSLSTKKELTYSRFVILKLILKPVLFALLAVFLFEIGEYFFLQNKSLIKPYAPDKIVEIWHWLKEKFKIEVSAYRPFLSPLVTISATFLGLYFTALNVLLSSTYKQVTTDVRKLLIRDKVGNTYIQIVAFTGAYSLILFGLTVINYTPSFLSLVLLVLLGITEIYCFINQWFRLFHLFDPSMLVYYLGKDLIQWIERATVNGLWSQDANFQSHFQAQAEDTLNAYRNLITTVKGEEHLRSQSLITLSNSLLELLLIYELEKAKIPSQSKWFKTTYQHKNWMTASHPETAIAAQTGTTLLPKEISDIMWIEKEIGKLIDFSLKGFLEKQDLPNALNLFQNFQGLTRRLARIYSVEEALLLFRIIKINTKNYARSFNIAKDSIEDDSDSLRFTIALVDFYALSFINILLGFIEGTERISLESLEKFIEKTDWKKKKNLYRAKFPRKVLQQLELSKKHLDFERTIEGKIVTPDWYHLQLLTLSYFQFLETTINSLLIGLEEVYLKEASSLAEQKKHFLAIQLIERGFEACNKFHHNFYDLEKHCNELNKSRLLSDIYWVDFSWEEYQKKIELIHEQLIVLYSESLYPIMDFPKIEDLPDYFGHAYTVLTEECFKSMAFGKEELFKKIFGNVFISCIEAHLRQKELEIKDIDSKFVLVADPIIDLFELSGYAIIYQELGVGKFWDIAQARWDAYFAGRDDKPSLIKLFIMFGTHKSFLMSPLSSRRASWQQYLAKDFQQRGLMRNDFIFGSYYEEEENNEHHSSKIIRILTRSIMLHDKAREFFVVIYFKNEIKNQEVEVPHNILGCYKEVYGDESE